MVNLDSLLTEELLRSLYVDSSDLNSDKSIAGSLPLTRSALCVQLFQEIPPTIKTHKLVR